MRNIKNLYIILIVLVLVMLGGFYFLSAKINNLETSLQSQGSQSPASSTANVNSGQSSSGTTSTGTSTASSSQPESPGISVSSNILFNASSSTSLQPQTNLTILISRVSKMSDGTVAVAVKVFTDSATSYSAVDMSSLIQVFNIGGSNGVSNNIVGAFKAMPPQGAVDGVVNFSGDPSAQSVILQVGSPDSPSFYEFDFDTGSYKQVTVG